jgi:hypothetical protein
LHVSVHWPPAHTAVPCGSVGQAVHEAPHAVASVSAAQAPPHACVDVLHVKPQVVPSHVAPTAFVGTGQGAQLEPQALTSIVLGHDCPHWCVAPGHTPLHAVLWSMHMPRQSFFPDGQVPPHWPLTQVAVPPFAGSRQGEHD